MSFFSNLFAKKPERVNNKYDSRQMLNEAQIESIRQESISLLRSTGRPGIEAVIEYLEKNGFFIVPSSVHHHHNWRGGLAQHSLDVYYKAKAKADPSISPDSLILVCLLHDICKADELCYDNEGNLCRSRTRHHGHGARSVSILDNCKLEMQDVERRAIRWHMGGHNCHSDEATEVNMTRREKLWEVLHYTDKSDARRDT